MTARNPGGESALLCLIEDIGFSSLTALLFTSGDSYQRFRTLPFVDAVYYPPDAEGVPHNVLPSTAPAIEEDIHLYQCRRSAAGWYLELLSRRVCLLVSRHTRGLCEVSEISNAMHLLAQYYKSIEAPLELEAHCLLGVYLMASEGGLVDKIHDQFLSMFSLGEERVDRDASRTYIQDCHLERWRSRLRDVLETESRSLEHTSRWLGKVGNALHAVSTDFWQKGVIPEEQYLEEMGNCLEFKTIPSVAGLMPTHHPKPGFLGTATDPHARMEKAAKSLEGLTECAIRTGDMSEIMRRIEGVIPVRDKREVHRRRVRAAKELSRDWPRCALGPLRLSPNSLDDALLSDWVPPSQLNSLVNDRYEASIIIRSVDGTPVPHIENDDAVGRRFAGDLGLLETGYEVLGEQ